ncbi:MAG: formate hydrogenlyase, partial [Betaproteobacteria bacterium]
MTVPLTSQLINLFASLILLVAFGMLAQRRIHTLVNLFAFQGAVLVANTLLLAWSTDQAHLYWSAGLTLLLKVIVLPVLLHRLIGRLALRRDVETLLNTPTILLVGIVLVIIAFNLALPIAQLAGTINRATLGIALASVLLAFLMMITRRKAVPQVIGFLSM